LAAKPSPLAGEGISESSASPGRGEGAPLPIRPPHPFESVDAASSPLPHGERAFQQRPAREIERRTWRRGFRSAKLVRSRSGRAPPERREQTEHAVPAGTDTT